MADISKDQITKLRDWIAQLNLFMEEQEGPIGEDEMEGFLENIGMPQIFADQEEMSPADQIASLMDRIDSDPEYRAMFMDKKNEAKFKKSLSLANDIITTGREISDAKEQIRQADQEEDALQKPLVPSALKKNPKLKAAMRRAEMDLAGEGDAAFLSPYERQAQDQYAKDMAVAKTASTGQAGAYGSYAQTASTNRMKGARGLVPLMAKQREGQQNQMNQLIGQDISEDQFIKRQELNLYGQNLGQYNTDRELIGKVGSSGRINRAMGRRTMGKKVTEGLGDPLYNSLPLKSRNYLNPVLSRFKNDLMNK